MTPLKAKGDLAEVMIAADLVRRGYRIAIPYGEIHLRLVAARNHQQRRIRFASSYLEI